jgi:hypothetical protein
MNVGLHLPRLLDLPGVGGNMEMFLGKLASLARMAVSAGLQKRNYLRRQLDRPYLNRGFLLERARLVITPVGLHAALRALTGQGEEALFDLARRVMGQLQVTLRQASRSTSLEIVLDCPCYGPGDAYHRFGVGQDSPLAGLSLWDASLPLKSQVKLAGSLQSVAGGGTSILWLPEGEGPGVQGLFELLRLAWERTEITRLRLLRVSARQQELALRPIRGT